MQLTGLLAAIRDSSAYRSPFTRLQAETITGHLSVIRSARPAVLATLAHDWQGPVIYLTAQVKRAYNVSEQLPVWLKATERIQRFAEPSAKFYDRVPWDKDVIRNRIATLNALLDESDTSPPIIVSSARALMQRTLACLSSSAITHRHSMSMINTRLIVCYRDG